MKENSHDQDQENIEPNIELSPQLKRLLRRIRNKNEVEVGIDALREEGYDATRKEVEEILKEDPDLQNDQQTS